jgi:hypothetical protein
MMNMDMKDKQIKKLKADNKRLLSYAKRFMDVAELAFVHWGRLLVETGQISDTYYKKEMKKMSKPWKFPGGKG